METEFKQEAGECRQVAAMWAKKRPDIASTLEGLAKGYEQVDAILVRSAKDAQDHLKTEFKQEAGECRQVAAMWAKKRPDIASTLEGLAKGYEQVDAILVRSAKDAQSLLV